MTQPLSVKEIVAAFDNNFTQSHPGDSGFDGNPPQEPVYEWTDGPWEVKPWLKSSLHSLLLEVKRRLPNDEYRFWQSDMPTTDRVAGREEGIAESHAVIDQMIKEIE